MKKFFYFLWVGIFCLTSFGFAALEGSITIVGSTSVQPLVEELSQTYMSLNKGVKVYVQGGGSGAGVKAAMEDAADFGSCSRELTSQESAALKEYTIAKDGIVIIVNKSNSVKNLSQIQLQKIYTGEYTNWQQVDGPNLPLNVINREAGSGTRGAFEELVLGKLSNTNNCEVQTSNTSVREAVSLDKQAIGYISYGLLDPHIVKALTYEKVPCSEPNILTRKYKLQRPFLLLTGKKGPSPLAKAFLDWILSPTGQKIVAKEYISVNAK